MKYIIGILLFSNVVNAEISVGYSHGYHLGVDNSNINNSHPFLGVNLGYFDTLVYLNSFDKVSVAPSLYLGDYFSEKGFFSLRVGLTSGYYGDDRMKGGVFVNKYMVFILPTFEYRMNKKESLFTNIMGNSLNFGYAYRF